MGYGNIVTQIVNEASILHTENDVNLDVKFMDNILSEKRKSYPLFSLFLFEVDFHILFAGYFERFRDQGLWKCARA